MPSMLGRKRSRSSEADGCPPQRGTPQRRFPPLRTRKAPPRRRKHRQRRRRRRRRNKITPPALSASHLASLVEGMQRMALGPPGNGVQPSRVCLPASSRSSEAGGCPPLRGTAKRCFPQLPKRKAPPSSLKKGKQRRRRRRITPRAMRAIARAHAADVVQRAAVGTQRNSMGPWRVHLLRHGVRPRCDSPPKDDVEPMEVDPPEHGLGPTTLNPPDNGVEPMEVDPPRQESSMAVGPPATGITWQYPSHPGSFA